MGMKIEAFSRSQILLTSNMDSDATSLARELQITMNPVQNSQNSQQTIPLPMTADESNAFMTEITQFRTDAWKLKLDAYGQLFDGMEKQMSALKAASAAGGSGTAKGAFSTFASGIESPVNFALSDVILMDRGFDSVNIDSHYIRVDTTSQDASSEAHSRSVSRSVEVGLSAFGAGASITSGATSATASKVASTMSQRNVEATLVLTAFATHRLVKQFNVLHLLPQNVRNAWNFYFPNDAIGDPEADVEGFEVAYARTMQEDAQRAAGGADSPTINLLTEIYQGSALVGLVHFVSHEGTSSTQASSSSSYTTEIKLKASAWIGSLTASLSQGEAAANEIARMASDAGLEVEFDLVVFGYSHRIKAKMIKFAVASFSDFDPSNFASGGLLADMSGGAASQATGSQQSNMDAVIKSTVKSLNTIAQDNPVLGIQTFMDAFDDYAEACKTGRDIGAPVGMNVKPFTKMDVMKLLAQKYLDPRKAGNAASSDADSSASQ